MYQCIKQPGKECDGCGCCKKNPFVCPACGNIPDERVYKNYDGDIVGCGRCLVPVYIEDMDDNFDEKDK